MRKNFNFVILFYYLIKKKLSSNQFFLKAICFHCVPGACEQHCNAEHRHDMLLDRQADCRKYNVGHAQHGMLNPEGP